MNEILCSLHNYTKFSGYTHTFYDIAQAALDCGLDAVLLSDRNVYPVGHDQYYYRAERRLIALCGEELSNPINTEDPHYLSLGIEREQFLRRPGNPLDEIRILLSTYNGSRAFRHIELLNAEDFLTRGIPGGKKEFRERIRELDKLLQTDQRILSFTGTCSLNHTEKYTYKELFSTAINHVYSDQPLNGDFVHDKLTVLSSLRAGHLYIALDGFADARGFRFCAEGNNQEVTAWPGDTIYIKNSITMKINIPEPCTCRLIRNGRILKEWVQCKQIPFTIYEPGYYRVECSLIIRRNEYDWIFSNPIFVVRG